MRDAIRHFAGIRYKGKSLMDHRVYLMGQICVHPDYRGKGVFGLWNVVVWDWTLAGA